jgi:hypothetical protein
LALKIRKIRGNDNLFFQLPSHRRRWREPAPAGGGNGKSRSDLFFTAAKQDNPGWATDDFPQADRKQ